MDEDKKTFRRLVLSSTDLSQAKRLVEFILENELYLENTEDKRTINRSLQTSAIVSYIRPFSGNYCKDDTFGKLDEKHLYTLNDDELKLHTHIKNLRNKVFAHTDSEVRGLKINITSFGNSKTAWSSSHNPFAPLPKELWLNFLEIINKVDGSIADEIVDMQGQFEENDSF
ncbi:MAG: hypothetical protein WD357_05380 [Gracilimonas sp.]